MSVVHDIRSASKYRQTVLVIDDQPLVLEIHVAIMRSVAPELRIIAMTDPKKALTWMRTRPVDLIVTDYKMHQMDGVSFVNAIKDSSHGEMKPIIVVTALKDEATHQTLLSAGVAACLTKPTSAVQLVAVSRQLLNKTKEYFAA